MTDESRLRSSRATGYAQTASPLGGLRSRRTEDPLAELARLIGQEDPFADFVSHRPAGSRFGGNGGTPRAVAAPRPADRRPTSAPREPVPDYGEEFETVAPTANGRGNYAYGLGRTLPRRPEPAPEPVRGLREERAPLRSRAAEADYDYEDEPRAARSRLRREEPAYDERDRAGWRDARTARRAPAKTEYDDDDNDYAADNYDPDYDDQAYLPAHGEEFYEESSGRRSRRWMLLAAAVIGIAVVGGSGVFAYRTIFGVTEGPPRTISADAAPTKVAPGSAQEQSEGGGNKQIYDRIGGEPASGERVVSREEQPMDVARAARTAPIPASGQAAPTLAAPVPATTEPRRVRTVTVRADGTVTETPPPPRAATAHPAPRGAQPAASSGPLAVNTYAGAGPGQPAAAAPAPSARQGSSDNPWADISTSGRPATQAAGPMVQAALPPPAPRTAPIVAVQSPPPAGSYVVQVASQKTEADAQATWQSLQQRFSTVLSGQPAAIRRVDLGERGVFYRAQVGPFNSRTQASELCQSLKAAGGECVIQRN